MQVPVLIVAVIALASWIIRYAVAIHLAARGLEAAYQAEGVDWCFWSDLSFRKKLFLDPENIISGGDSAMIFAAKTRLIRCRAQMQKVLLVGIAIGVVGFALTIAAGLSDIYWV